jgi:saccharopine dehydrogenase-like NADP-dependent oxidoreductase
VTITAGVKGGMGGATGVPMAIGLKMMAKGKIARHGVFAPEAVMDPDAFFDEFGLLCTPPRANAGELLMVTMAVDK